MHRLALKSISQGMLFAFFLYLQTAQADTISTWVGGTPACPTCWNQAPNWSPGGVPNGAFSVVISSGGPQPTLDTTPASIDNLTLGSGATLSLDNGVPLSFTPGNVGGTSSISNAGTINITASGSSSGIGLGAGITNLSGGGTINLNASSVSLGTILSNSTSPVTLNSASLIQGSGTIGSVPGTTLTFNNGSAGVLNANNAGVGLLLNAPTASNQGLIEATGGANLALYFTGLNNTGGTVSAASGSTVQLSGSSIGGGTLQTSGGGQILQSGGTSTLFGSTALNGLFNVANGNALNLGSAGSPLTLTLGSGASLNLNSAGSTTDLVLSGATTTLTGGAINLSNNANNRIYGNISGGATLNNGSIIQGAGQIGLVGTALTLNNSGTINGTQPAGLTINGAIANSSLMEATGGGLLTLNGTLNNNGGTLTAGAGSTLQLNGVNVTNTTGFISATGAGSTVGLNNATISGGILQATGGGQFTQSGSYSTLTGGSIALNGLLNIGNGSGIYVATGGSPFGLNMGAGGGIALNSAGSSTDLAFNGTNGTVNLNGPVTMSNNVNNRIYANSAGMTLNNNSTIQGAGQIGLVANPFTFNNTATGIVNANQTTALSLGGAINNTGLLEATNGGTLSLAGTTITNPGTIFASGAGSIVNLSNTTVNGGTLQAASGGQLNQSGSYSTFGGGTLALNGNLNIANGSGLYLNTAGGSLSLNFGSGGGIGLNSTGSSTDLAMTGTNGIVNLNGPVTMSNSVANRIYATNSGMTLNNSGTIQGAGQIGLVAQPFTLVNTGTINANQSAGLSLSGTIDNTSGLLTATNGATLTLGGTINNTGSTISATGAGSGLQLNSVGITNTGGVISAAGGAIGLNGATINGGTLQTGAGGSFLQSGSYSTFGGGAIRLNAGTLNITNGSGIYLNTGGGSFSLNTASGGSIALNSTGSSTDLAMTGTNGTVNLNGPVTMSSSAANRIYASSTGMTLNNNSTIQGAGTINLVGSGFTLNNGAAGVINSNQMSTLGVGGTVNNAGLLEATNDSTLSLGGATINNSATIGASSGGFVALNNTTINGGTLLASGGGAFGQSGGYSTFGGSSIGLNTGLTVVNGSGIYLSTGGGTFSLNTGAGGSLNLNSIGSSTDLALTGAGGTVNLNGPVTLSNSAANRIYANSTGMTMNNSGTIQGAGQIGAVGALLNVNNTGTILANQSAGITMSGNIVNTSGLLEATNGATLTLSNGTLNNTGSTVSATGPATNLQFTNMNVTNTSGTISVNGADSIAGLNGATITGGTLQALGGAQFTQSGSYSTFNGAIGLNTAFNVANGSGIYLNTGGLTAALNGGAGGILNLNSTGSNTDLAISGAGGAAVLGAPVTMSNNTANRIYANSSGMTLINNSTIQGAGQIGVVGNPLAFLNSTSGVVNANQSAGLSLSGPITNQGLLEATNGSTLNLAGAAIGNSSGIISAAGAGSIVSLTNTSIAGGTLQSSGGGLFTQSGSYSTLSGSISLNGFLNIANGSGITFNAASAPVTLTVSPGGGLNVNSTGSNTDLALEGTNGTVSLNGPISLSDSASNRIYANSTGMTLNNGGVIQGSGQIGVIGNPLTFVNNGTLLADNPMALTIGATEFTNNGTLQTSSGSTLTITAAANFTNFNGTTLSGGAITDSGIVQWNNANVVNNGADITMIGAAAEIEALNGINGLRNFDDNLNNGTFALEGGAIFTASGPFSNTGFVDIADTDLFGSGTYTQTGGTTQVDGALAAAAVNIDGGVLTGAGAVNGNVAVTSGGAVDPGDAPGTLTVSGNYAQSSTGALNLLFAGAGAGQFDVLKIGGTASLGGALNLSTLAGFTPFTGETFKVITFGSSAGTFSSVTGTSLGDGFTFEVEYDPTDVTVVVNGSAPSTPEPATWMLLIIGAGAIAVARCRRKAI